MDKIVIYGGEKSVEKIAAIVFHEYGHLIFEHTFSKGIDFRIYCETRKYYEAATKCGRDDDWGSWIKTIGCSDECPVMITDAIGMIDKVDFHEFSCYGCHDVDYDEDNLETEMYAEYFSYFMVRNRKMLRRFEEMCPKSARLLNKQVTRLFK